MLIRQWLKKKPGRSLRLEKRDRLEMIKIRDLSTNVKLMRYK
jgi:hypothetical protein